MNKESEHLQLPAASRTAKKRKPEERVSLLAFFQEVNAEHFDALLAPPELVWNSRLRSSAGRFTPGSRKFWMEERPCIEVASYLLEEENADELIWDTVAHEMIHYWLWLRGRPYGHTKEFLIKMREMGVSRYNPVPRQRKYKYEYQCIHCEKAFPMRRRIRGRACATCCDRYSKGKYDSRFRLVLKKKL